MYSSLVVGKVTLIQTPQQTLTENVVFTDFFGYNCIHLTKIRIS